MNLMRRDFLLTGTLAAAAMTSATGPVLAQNTPPADAGTQQPPPSTAPYEGSKANQKLRIVNLFDRQVEVYTDPDPTGSASRKDFLSGQQVPVVIDGRQVGQIAVNDILP